MYCAWKGINRTNFFTTVNKYLNALSFKSLNHYRYVWRMYTDTCVLNKSEWYWFDWSEPPVYVRMRRDKCRTSYVLCTVIKFWMQSELKKSQLAHEKYSMYTSEHTVFYVEYLKGLRAHIQKYFTQIRYNLSSTSTRFLMFIFRKKHALFPVILQYKWFRFGFIVVYFGNSQKCL